MVHVPYLLALLPSALARGNESCTESRPASVCLCVCVRHTSEMQSKCSYNAMRRNSSYTRHTLGQVSACMQRMCTYGHRCCNNMNSDDRVRRIATLRKRKQREKDYSDSKSFNFARHRVSVNLLATAFTIDFHMPLNHSLFT